jgi:sensor domain CHASE-containing protein
MTLRKKTLLVVGLTLVALMVVVYAVTSRVLLRGVAELEEYRTREHVERVREAFADELGKLAYNVRDWAEWDDTYDFIETGSPAYVKANLQDTSIASLGLNLIAYVHASGRIVFAEGFDLATRRATPVPAGVLAHLAPGRPLVTPRDPRGGATGGPASRGSARTRGWRSPATGPATRPLRRTSGPRSPSCRPTGTSGSSR